jgi:RNA polymerase sigma-70 factor, ECF subfamily
MLMTDELRELVGRAQAGDGAAFAALYERFRPEVQRYLARRLGPSWDEAEDLTAEVFLKVFARLGGYQERGVPFSVWLFRIARNHLIDRARARPKRPVGSIDDAPEIAEPRAELALERALDRLELKQALRRLTDGQRQVVVLRFLEGRSVAETAAAVGKTGDAVKQVQARGLLRLRRVLEPTRQATQAPAIHGPAAAAVAA